RLARERSHREEPGIGQKAGPESGAEGEHREDPRGCKRLGLGRDWATETERTGPSVRPGPLKICRTGRKRTREAGWGDGAPRFEHWGRPVGPNTGAEHWGRTLGPNAGAGHWAGHWGPNLG